MITTYAFNCQARNCDEEYESFVPMNQTIWCMQDDGWQIEVDQVGRTLKVLCPLHTKVRPNEIWLVECLECDYEEQYSDPDEAEDDAADHNHDCDCGIWHDARVISPEKQKERKERQRKLNQEIKQAQFERDVHDRYVAFLIQQDQQRKQDMENATPKERWETQHKWALVVTGLFFLLVVNIVIAIILGKVN